MLKRHLADNLRDARTRGHIPTPSFHHVGAFSAFEEKPTGYVHDTEVKTFEVTLGVQFHVDPVFSAEVPAEVTRNQAIREIHHHVYGDLSRDLREVLHRVMHESPLGLQSPAAEKIKEILDRFSGP